MHSNLRHRHPARSLERREDMALENSDSLANVVERAQDDVATVYSVVYVTASATFSGPTAGFVTVGLPSSTAAAKTSTNNQDGTSTKTKTGTASTASKTGSTASAKTATSSDATTKSAASTSSTASAAVVTVTSSPSSSVVVVTASSATSSSSSASSSSSSSVIASSSALSSAVLAQATISSSATPSASAAASSSGLSSGAKGGVAFAVILGIGFIAGLAFFCIRRKKEQRKNMQGAQRLDDEKSAIPIPAVNITPAPPVAPVSPPPAMAMTAAPPVARSAHPAIPPSVAPYVAPTVVRHEPAPRLSIRPTSGFTFGEDAEKTAASISAMAAAAAAADSKKSTNSTTDPANPFGIHAETITSPTDRPALKPSDSTLSFELQGSPVPANTRLSSIPDEVEPPFDPKSATNVIMPVTAAAAAVAAAGPIGAQPLGNNVHRVQLEFAPTRDDEFELKVGQLVRIAHEYDDGWVLCMSMDRTKTGAAPRTCLSKLPLKPRPTGPPGRPMSPMGPPAAGMRKVSAPVGPQNPLVPAPLTAATGRPSPAGPPALQERQRTASSGPLPSQQRSQSPGPSPSKPMADSRPRSISVGTANNGSSSGSPTASSPLNPLAMSAIPSRKPVPGQAL